MKAFNVARNMSRTVNYSVAGVAAVRVVITDANERYPKVHWDEAPAGVAFESLIEWEGRWADGSLAVPGEYLRPPTFNLRP